MDVNLHHAGIELDARSYVVFRHARGTRLLCVSGALWITQDGDQNDHFARPGETFEITVAGAVVVQAQRASRLVLLDGAHARRPDGVARLPGAARLDGRPPLIAQLHGA